MFVTHESWTSNASALLGEGHTCMRIVEWQSCYHFYQVIVEEKQNEKMIARQYFLNDVDVLEDILEKQSQDFKVTEVLLMSPAWMNGSAGWAMNKVLSLIIGRGEEGGKVSMHKVAEGVVYTSPAGGEIDTLEEEGFKVLI